ncbi:hypothetical protein GO280_01406 [Ralstonia solanacearum]|nr:hypothetical protein [Ralstonia solanacearum]
MGVAWAGAVWMRSTVVMGFPVRQRRRRAARAAGGARRIEQMCPVDDLQLALHRFDQRREALDPVAVVAVELAVDLADLGLVDVPADHAVAAAPARLVGHHALERVDVVDRVLHLVLQVLRQRPVRESQPHADAVEMPVHRQDQRVQRVAHVGEPARVLHHAVEQVAVHHPQALAGGGHVDGVLGHLDVAEVQAVELARHLIVVAGDEHHAGALARAAQHLLHHVVVRLRPVPAAAQLPAVDDIADEVQRVGRVVLEEIQQEVGLAARRAEVDVRQPDGAIAVDFLGGRIGVRLRLVVRGHRGRRRGGRRFVVAHVAPSGRRAKRAGGGESGGHLHQGRSGVPVGTDGGRGAKALREAAKKTGASWQDHVGNSGCVGWISPPLCERAVSET